MSNDVHSPATAEWLSSLTYGSPVTSPVGAFSCTVEDCRQVFPRASLRGDHVRDVHQPSHVVCDTCGTDFNQATELRKHMELSHLAGPPFRCSSSTNIRSRCSCGRCFPTRSSLHKHQRSFVASTLVSPAVEQDGTGAVTTNEDRDQSLDQFAVPSVPTPDTQVESSSDKLAQKMPNKRPPSPSGLSCAPNRPTMMTSGYVPHNTSIASYYVVDRSEMAQAHSVE
jgi:hypothetical protein